MLKLIKIFAVINSSLLIFIYFVVYPYLVRRDFDTICDSFSTTSQTTNRQEMAILAAEISQKIEDSIITPSVKELINAIGPASKTEKYQLLLDAAKDHNYDTWQCPSAKEFFSH